MGKKRGQATIFIIIGLVVVILALVLAYFQSETFREGIRNFVVGSRVVPEQVDEVVSSIDKCIADVGEEGARIMGMNGGYINLPTGIANNPRLYLQFDAITKLPYWLFGEKEVRIPQTGVMERQLEDYIESRIPEECPLEDYRERGYNFLDDNIDVRVNIADKSILIRLTSPLNVEVREMQFSLSDYVFVELPFELGRLRNMGEKLVERELRTPENSPGIEYSAPLEFNTLNLISIYSKDNHFIPPISGFEFRCSARRWSYLLTVRGIRDILTEYTPYLSVEGTRHDVYNTPIYNTMIIDDVYPNSNEDVRVDFNYYEKWPLFVDVNPRKGDTIKSEGIRAGFPLLTFCMNNYNFRYDIRYPVLVTMTTEDGYTLRFPVEVLIIDNLGRISGSAILGEVADLSTADTVPNFFCDDDQRHGALLNVDAYDAVSNRPLEGADVIYICNQGLRNCALGETGLREGVASFSSNLPLCVGGELRVEKEGFSPSRDAGFLPYRRELSSFDTIEPIVALLEPYREIEARVLVLEESNTGLVERALREDESVAFQISKINDELEDYDDERGISFSDDTKLEEKKVELVPGNYELSYTLTRKGNVVLAEALDQPLDEVVLGGATTQWNVNNQLDEPNAKVVLYAISRGVPRNFAELERNMDFEETSSLYQNELTPRFE